MTSVTGERISVEWEFDHLEECYYIDSTRHKVEKSRAYHSLRGRITGEELYTILGCNNRHYYRPYRTYDRAFDALKKNIRFRIKCLQERLQELEQE